MRPRTAENYHSAYCRFGGCERCREDKPSARPVEGLIYLVCTCPCHTALERREAAIRAAEQKRK
ncbi:hypothetical protein [Streptomyces carminius]|uniref:hypothetical protein n=1 Tax=Streptomyces carminius TaxID=2665496 RepID=UPI0011B373B8|nr:hypothetical protein [Streptomyces carminius]